VGTLLIASETSNTTIALIALAGAVVGGLITGTAQRSLSG